MKNIALKNVMTKKLISLSQGDSLARAYEAMIDNDIRHIPILDHNKTLIGVVSDRDILVDAAKDRLEQLKPADLLIKDVMNSSVLTAKSADTLHHGIQIMLEHKVNSLPIVDADHKLEGIVTSTDIMRLVFHMTFTDHDRTELIDAFQKASNHWPQA